MFNFLFNLFPGMQISLHERLHTNHLYSKKSPLFILRFCSTSFKNLWLHLHLCLLLYYINKVIQYVNEWLTWKSVVVDIHMKTRFSLWDTGIFHTKTELSVLWSVANLLFLEDNERQICFPALISFKSFQRTLKTES